MAFFECALIIAGETQTKMKHGFLYLNRTLCDSRKLHDLTREFHIKYYMKNRNRSHRLAISAISVFRVKFNQEFSR